MMKDLQDYQTRKTVLCEWYDRVIENNKLLQTDVKALQEAKSNLQDGRFIVAVCGEMNSGKSTLLNALLFSEEVLPSYATTMTAKIALMDGDNAERIEATLYTPDEFRKVAKASKSKEHSAQELAEARESARAEGLKEPDLLTDPARVISEDGLDKLVQFAALYSRGGIYSAYVNSVQLWADRPWLHQVTVADTPGTNDPNPVRDSITRDWIKRADAVVYVTDAGQAGINASDVKFIDEHLAHIDPQRLIIAVNKCDNQLNTEAIQSHIRKTQASGDLRMKSLFGNDDQIVLVSGLGALISAMQEAGRPLSGVLTEYAVILSRKGYLEPERHGLERLRNVIERRIIATKGDGIIQVHQRRLDSIFESAEAGISQDKAILTANRDVINASTEKREEEVKRIKENIDSINSVVGNARKKFVRDLDEAQGPLHESIMETINNVSRGIDDDLKQIKNIDNLVGQAIWGIQSKLYSKRNALADAIGDVVKKIESALNQAENELSETLLASELTVDHAPQYHLLPVTSRTICKEAEDKLLNTLDRETLENAVRATTSGWQRFWNMQKGRNSAVETLRPILGEHLKTSLENLSHRTRRELEALGEKALQTMQENCRRNLNERDKLLEELKKEISSGGNKRREIEDQIAELEQRKRQLDAIKDEYDLEMGA